MKLHRLIFILLLSKGVARILDWRGPNHKSHAMTSSEIFKEKIFVKQRYVEQRYRRSFYATKKMRSCGLVCQKLKSENVKIGRPVE